jgi:DNA invertase Pin-like site-specific DNA recombinase
MAKLASLMASGMKTGAKKPATPAGGSEKSQPFKIGYARVSMRDQNPQLQIDALEGAGCDKIYVETKSGASTKNRPEYDLMMRDARPGDIVIVWKLDRLGRNTQEVLATFEELTKKDVQVMVLTNREMDTTTPTGRLIITIMAAVAQLEREFTIERTKAGLDAARKAGRYGGRRSKHKDETIKALYEELGPSGAARKLRLSRVQVIKRMNKIKQAEADEAALKLLEQENADANPET